MKYTCLLNAFWLCALARSHAEHPNVVLIFADDMGFGDVSSYNPDSKIKTPHMDRLVSEGMQFLDAHSASGVCTPSRYSLLTGRYSWRTSLKSGVLGGFSRPLIKEGRMTFGHVFKQKKYKTACIGKWHLGMEWHRTSRDEKEHGMRNAAGDTDFSKPIKRTALANGFDYYFGIAASLDMPPYAFIENDRVTALPTSTKEKERVKGGRAGPTVPGWKHEAVMPTLTDKAIEFIDKGKESPFFVYMPLNSPHTPHAPSEEFIGKSGLDIYGDFMVEVDHSVGRVMAALDKAGIAHKTLLIVTSDNGPETNMFSRRKRTGHDSSYKFLGAKRDNWEGGHRVPFIARWPGVIKPGSKSSEPFCLVDMIATFADLLGIDLPEDQAVDSVTILPLMKGGKADYRREHGIIHHSSKGNFALRLGDWKLLLHAGSGGNGYGGKGKKVGRYKDTIEQRSFNTGERQLFNMRDDPYETKNLAGQNPERVREFTRLAAKYVKNGRSTPGKAQPYVSENWKQIEWTAGE
ncbi:MAG: arylsulfatase [Planctomycetota bacterium]|jgi:arylsulfatase A-like enzyme|nr:arylsulfatase [Planctomycetota bacterium]